MLGNHTTGHLFFCCIILLSFPAGSNAQEEPLPVAAESTFTNPLLPAGPDPWVVQKDTNYYYTNTFGNQIALYKTSRMSNLGKTIPVTIWLPPASGPYAKDIWAPEIHYLQNKWYIYFAADDGHNESHRIYVLENASADPLKGPWEFKGKIADTAADKWAIDASVFSYGDALYFIWSGWDGDMNVMQNIYIEKMKSPTALAGPRVMISTPTYDWEKKGAPPAVNEGPEAITNSSGNVFITYSASGCWTDYYALGLLTLRPGGDPLTPADWHKTPEPVFQSAPASGAYAPGHNGFFISRDGKESWIIYHANTVAGQGCGGDRSPRMQGFSWNKDGSPNFGQPLSIHIKVKKPGGE